MLTQSKKTEKLFQLAPEGLKLELLMWSEEFVQQLSAFNVLVISQSGK
jgi:hypothetical protein